MLPTIEEIAGAIQQEEKQELPREYQEYLERLEHDYLNTCKTFAMARDFLLTFTANGANATICFLCIDFGMNWLTAGIAGLAFGLVPVAKHLNDAGIDLSSDYKVRSISSLLLAGANTMGATGASWNAVKEWKQLLDWAREGQTHFEKEVASYEIRVKPTENLTLVFQFQMILGISAALAVLGWFLRR